MSGEVPSSVAPGVTPAAEVEVTDSLVRRLIEAQYPWSAHERLERLANGWDNVTYRLGRDLAVRLPRRSAAVDLIAHEQRWLPFIARHTAMAVPEPIYCGSPGEGFPWPWSVVRWVPGETADVSPPHPDEAAGLGEFLSTIHALQPAPDAPRNPFRGIPLAGRRQALGDRLDRLETIDTGLDLPVAAIRDTLHAIMRIEIDRPDGWLHGDLHVKNLVVEGGRISGVIDWGDMCAGDVATDLATAWIVFETSAHADFWEAYGGTSRATRERARGWALFFGVMLLDSALDHDPSFAAAGKRTIERALERV